MYFEEENIEDKGLFTFYREEGQREDQLRRNKKLRKQRKKIEQLSKKDEQIVSNPPKQFLPVKIKTVSKVFSPKQYIKKERASLCKQRLVQSIVDMGYLIRRQQQKQSLWREKQKVGFKLTQSGIVSRMKIYKQRREESKHQLQLQTTIMLENNLTDDKMVGQYERNNDHPHLTTRLTKLGTHTMRSSFGIPQIRKSEQRIKYRPKKSIKSKIILQALKMNDSKTRNIRDQTSVGRLMLQLPLFGEYPQKDYYTNLKAKHSKQSFSRPKDRYLC